MGGPRRLRLRFSLSRRGTLVLVPRSDGFALDHVVTEHDSRSPRHRADLIGLALGGPEIFARHVRPSAEFCFITPGQAR